MATPNLGQRIQSGLGQMATGPIDPQMAAGMDPQYLQQLRQNAMLQLGLGMVSAGRQPGGTLGGALNAGLGQAQGGTQGAMQQAYVNAMRNKADTRADQSAQREADRLAQQQTHQQWLESHTLDREKTADQRYGREQEYRQEQTGLAQERWEAEQKLREQSFDRRGLGQPPAGYRSNAQGNLEFIPGGPADPSVASSRLTLRPIPSSAAQGIIENRASLKQLDRALAAVEQNPDAFGAQNYMPDMVTQRLGGKGFSGGLDARAQVSDIGSLKLHDRSGAAVTAAEFPRLKPFIPLATDQPETVKTKLQNFKANVEAMQEEIESFYTPESGYRPISGARPQQAAPLGGGLGNVGSVPASTAPAAGAVEDGYRFIGGDPSNPNSWEPE